MHSVLFIGSVLQAMDKAGITDKPGIELETTYFTELTLREIYKCMNLY